MNVADDVERPVFLLQIIPQRLALNDSGFDFLQRLEHMDVAKSFAFQSAQ